MLGADLPCGVATLFHLIGKVEMTRSVAANSLFAISRTGGPPSLQIGCKI